MPKTKSTTRTVRAQDWSGEDRSFTTVTADGMVGTLETHGSDYELVLRHSLRDDDVCEDVVDVYPSWLGKRSEVPAFSVSRCWFPKMDAKRPEKIERDMKRWEGVSCGISRTAEDAFEAAAHIIWNTF